MILQYFLLFLKLGSFHVFCFWCDRCAIHCERCQFVFEKIFSESLTNVSYMYKKFFFVRKMYFTETAYEQMCTFKLSRKLSIKFILLHCLSIHILEVTKNFTRNIRHVLLNVWRGDIILIISDKTCFNA